MKDETEWPMQTWSRRYDHFLIEVRRRTHKREVDGDPYERRGPYLWTLYAYIYPSHWHFASFDGNKHWQPATDDMPLHGGCTFLEYHWRQGETGLVVWPSIDAKATFHAPARYGESVEVRTSIAEWRSRTFVMAQDRKSVV